MFIITEVVMDMSIWNIAEILGVVLGTILLIYLLRVNKGLKRYTPLIVFVVLVIIEFGVSFIVDAKLIKNLPHLLYLTEPFNMLYGLMIFLYARSLDYKGIRLKKTDIILLVPFVLSMLNYIPYYFLDSAEKYSDFLTYGGLKTDVAENIWEWIFEVLINVVFLWEALKYLGKYNSDIKDRFSDIQRVDLNLTQLLIKFCMGTYLVQLVFVYMTYYGFPYYDELFLVSHFLVIGMLLLIGYDAVVSSKYINELQTVWVKLSSSEVRFDGQIVKYAKSTLDDESSERIRNDLKNYMEENRPYLQPQLRIKELSELINIPSHQISQVINESFGQNFYEFVNSYRVNAAKKLLKDSSYKDYTYTAIGFEVGFNSKSAFYNAFKKVTGTTPAQFK